MPEGLEGGGDGGGPGVDNSYGSQAAACWHQLLHMYPNVLYRKQHGVQAALSHAKNMRTIYVISQAQQAHQLYTANWETVLLAS